MTETKAVLRRSRDYLAIIGVCVVLAGAFHHEQQAEAVKPLPQAVKVQP